MAAAGRFPALILDPAAIHSKIIVTCWSLTDQSLRSQSTLDEYEFPVSMVWIPAIRYIVLDVSETYRLRIGAGPRPFPFDPAFLAQHLQGRNYSLQVLTPPSFFAMSAVSSPAATLCFLVRGANYIFQVRSMLFQKSK
jgi:hypothetical protein